LTSSTVNKNKWFIYEAKVLKFECNLTY
jgi:hypothetical protein